VETLHIVWRGILFLSHPVLVVHILATSSDERFAFLVARHCALHYFVDIHFMSLHSWLNKLIEIDYKSKPCTATLDEHCI